MKIFFFAFDWHKTKFRVFIFKPPKVGSMWLTANDLNLLMFCLCTELFIMLTPRANVKCWILQNARKQNNLSLAE